LTVRFDRDAALVVVEATLVGPEVSANVDLALDTGATDTLIDVAVLAGIGLDPEVHGVKTMMLTGSGVALVRTVVVPELSVLGKTRRRLAVVAHTLPPGSGVDGLLGLDFLRGTKLTIDFRRRTIDLA